MMETRQYPAISKIRKLRAQILKFLHTRHVLILGCVLVVLECMCIMAELMVDLQGIRIRFENEEQEVKKFVQYMKAQNPDAFSEFEGTTLEEILVTLKETTVLWSPSDTSGCDCKCDILSENTSRRRRSPNNDSQQLLDNMQKSEKETFKKAKNINGHSFAQMDQTFVVKYTTIVYKTISSFLFQCYNLVDYIRNAVFYASSSISWNGSRYHNSEDLVAIPQPNVTPVTSMFTAGNQRQRRSVNKVSKPYLDVFVFSVNLDQEDFHIVAKFKNLSDAKISLSSLEDEITKMSYSVEYEKIHDLSLGIKYAGFGILTLMLAETLLKFVCTGLGIFKKKFEVFDAFIVISSFILDVIFLDSRWYESGKDATTILVLLLPWRVVRIVNNFLMTINHKHYIEIMTIKKAKKKGDIKLKKLEGLLVEIRKDIDLLINLAKTKGATDTEITACIYGKGRTTTLAAITSFASLMVISTLGKDPNTSQIFDDVYGDVIQDILEEDTDSDKVNSEDTGDKIEFDLESIDEGESSWANKSNSSKKSMKGKWKKDKRRATLPRRHASRNGVDDDVFYVNDAFVPTDEIRSRSSSLYSKSNVHSLPMMTKPKSNYVVFKDAKKKKLEES